MGEETHDVQNRLRRPIERGEVSTLLVQKFVGESPEDESRGRRGGGSANDQRVGRVERVNKTHPNQLSKREEIKERRSLKNGMDSPMI